MKLPAVAIAAAFAGGIALGLHPFSGAVRHIGLSPLSLFPRRAFPNCQPLCAGAARLERCYRRCGARAARGAVSY